MYCHSHRTNRRHYVVRLWKVFQHVTTGSVLVISPTIRFSSAADIYLFARNNTRTYKRRFTYTDTVRVGHDELPQYTLSTNIFASSVCERGVYAQTRVGADRQSRGEYFVRAPVQVCACLRMSARLL